MAIPPVPEPVATPVEAAPPTPVIPALPVPPLASTTSADATLAAELKVLTEGLLFLSESEAPFTVVELPKEAVLPDALRALAHLPADATAEEWSVSDLLTPFTDPEQPDAARYQALLTFLETKLTRAVAYKLETIKKPVFLIGRQPDKTWLGVQTEAVET